MSGSQHLRPRDGTAQPVTAVELFFDLVYVFAVTQLSHLVIDHRLSAASIAQAAFLLLVVWWAWIYTTWMVNWFDPGSVPVRLVLVAVGLASLLMSAAIPKAFSTSAPLFAIAYVVLQVGRNLAGALLLDRAHSLRLTFERIVAWSCASGVLWVTGAFVAGSPRMALWGPALAIDLSAPLLGYWTPRRGSSGTQDYAVEGGHFAERFQAFIIIALGESIVVTGATASALGLTAGTVGALAVAFLGTGALWWLYFGEVAEHSRRHLAASDDPGRLARDAYSYLHLPIVTGVIMVAVADDLLINRPGESLAAVGIAMTVGGPMLYLGGETLFRLRMIGSVNPKRVACLAALGVLGVAGSGLPAVALSGTVAVLLTALGVWEYAPVRVAAAVDAPPPRGSAT